MISTATRLQEVPATTVAMFDRNMPDALKPRDLLHYHSGSYCADKKLASEKENVMVWY
jgi:hypothetical protein